MPEIWVTIHLTCLTTRTWIYRSHALTSFRKTSLHLAFSSHLKLRACRCQTWRSPFCAAFNRKLFSWCRNGRTFCHGWMDQTRRSGTILPFKLMCTLICSQFLISQLDTSQLCLPMTIRKKGLFGRVPTFPDWQNSLIFPWLFQ